MIGPPAELNGHRVLRYRGDTAADWDAPWYVEGGPMFQGEVTAIAIVEDEPSCGVLILYRYADGTVADGWEESLEDALDAERELKNLPWVEVAPE